MKRLAYEVVVVPGGDRPFEVALSSNRGPILGSAPAYPYRWMAQEVCDRFNKFADVLQWFRQNYDTEYFAIARELFEADFVTEHTWGNY